MESGAITCRMSSLAPARDQPHAEPKTPDFMVLQIRPLSWAIVWLTLLLGLSLAGGCAAPSSTKIRLEPKPTDGQTISYQRGQTQMQAGGANPVRLTVVDHAGDQLVVHVSVENRGTTEYLFSEQNLSGEMVSGKWVQPLAFYTYEEVLEELDDSDEKLAAEAGSTAVSVGSKAVPYGGTMSSIAQLAMAASTQDGNDPEARLDVLTRAALENNAYIRRNTMSPGSTYEGILRVALLEPLSECESMRFNVQVGADLHRFVFDCRAVDG